MKYLLLFAGVLILLFSVAALAKYGLDYDHLSEYGKGYVWGKVILLLVGIVLVYVGFSRFKKGK